MWDLVRPPPLGTFPTLSGFFSDRVPDNGWDSKEDEIPGAGVGGKGGDWAGQERGRRWWERKNGGRMGAMVVKGKEVFCFPMLYLIPPPYFPYYLNWL